MSRRAAYLSVARTSAWLADLRALHAQGLSDRAIARELSKRYPHLAFSRRKVHYWRVEMIERSETGRLADYPTLAQARLCHYRRYQSERGLGYLLPDYQRPTPNQGEHGRWTDGVILTPRQSDILALVRDHGPLSRPKIARLLGRHPWCYLWTKRDECPVRALLNLGLLVPLAGPWPRQYRVCEGVARPLCYG
jgi:hypothetical protein